MPKFPTLLFRCMDADCTGRTDPETPYSFSAPANVECCPKCGAEPPAIIPVVRVCLIVDDPVGPIRGRLGKKLALACDRTLTLKAASRKNRVFASEWDAVNCPACRETAEWHELMNEDPPEALAEKARKLCETVEI